MVQESAFEIEEVADTIGNGKLTNLLLSREEQDIFSEKNQSFVARITSLVGDRLEQELADGSSIILSRQDSHYLIEKALIENEAFDVAKSLLFARKIEDGSGGLDDEEEVGIQLRLIRRMGKWFFGTNQNRGGYTQQLFLLWSVTPSLP